MNKLLVFTDLDGTLMDHNDYCWDKARPAIALLEQKSFPLIINSSKTAAEIIAIRQQMNNHAPFICENGTVANIPKHHFNKELRTSTLQYDYDLHLFGKSYVDIISILNELREKYNFNFRGFHDMNIDELIEQTNLGREQAAAAKQRQGTEPLIWLDSDVQLNKFKSLLQIKGLALIKGGRFYHVMSPVDKGQAVTWMVQKYKKIASRVKWITVGLGDSYNDVAMLNVVDIPVLIKNQEIKQPDVTHIKQLSRVDAEGSAGWNQAVLGIIETHT